MTGNGSAPSKRPRLDPPTRPSPIAYSTSGSSTPQASPPANFGDCNDSPSQSGYQCQICSKTFKRKEHMKRHLTSHDQDSRLTCSRCHASFSRQDALKRHEALHNRDGSYDAFGESASARSKAAITKTRKACVNCARQKIKCDGEQPCKNCSAKPGSDCQYMSRSEAGSTSMTTSPTVKNEEREYRAPLATYSHSPLAQAAQSPLHQVRSSLSSPSPAPGRRGNVNGQAAHSAANFSEPSVSPYDVGSHSRHASSLAGPPSLLSSSSVVDSGTDSSYLPSLKADISAHHWNANRAEHVRLGSSSSSKGFSDATDPFMDVPLASATTSFTFPDHTFDWLFSTSILPPDHIVPHMSEEELVGHLPPQTTALGNWNDLELVGASSLASMSGTLAPHTLPENPTAPSLPPIQQVLHPQASAFASRPEQRHTEPLPPIKALSAPGSNDVPSRPKRANYSLAKYGIDPTQKSKERHLGRSLYQDNSWKLPDYCKLGFPIEATIGATPALIEAESIPIVTPFTQKNKDKLLQLMKLPDLNTDEKTRCYDLLASVSPATYNAFLQLYFQFFQPIYPFLHPPTFNADRCNVLVLAMVISIGAMYSRMPRASPFGMMLNRLVNISQFLVYHRTDRSKVREQSIGHLQAMLLNFIFSFSSGDRVLLEYSEAQRSPMISLIRRVRLLDQVDHNALPESTSEAESASLDEQWRLWVQREIAKRTGYIAFVADTEFSMSWNLPATISLEELKVDLPQHHDLWTATNAQEWKQRRESHPTVQITLIQLHEVFRQGELHRRLDHLGSDSFQKTIVAYSLSSLGKAIETLRSSCMRSQAEAITSCFQSLIIDVAEGEAANLDRNCFNGSVSEICPRVELVIRFLLLRSIVEPGDLQVLGGRIDQAEKRATLDKLRTKFDARPRDAWLLAIHSGRIVSIFRRIPTDMTYESLLLFYAAVSLNIVSRWWQGRTMRVYEFEERSSADAAPIRSSPSVSIESQSSMPYDLKLDELQFVSHKQIQIADKQRQIRLFFGSVELADAEAPSQILKHCSELLRKRAATSPWPISEPLGAILAEMAELSRSASPQHGPNQGQDQAWDPRPPQFHDHGQVHSYQQRRT